MATKQNEESENHLSTMVNSLQHMENEPKTSKAVKRPQRNRKIQEAIMWRKTPIENKMGSTIWGPDGADVPCLYYCSKPTQPAVHLYYCHQDTRNKRHPIMYIYKILYIEKNISGLGEESEQGAGAGCRSKGFFDFLYSFAVFNIWLFFILLHFTDKFGDRWIFSENL